MRPDQIVRPRPLLLLLLRDRPSLGVMLRNSINSEATNQASLAVAPNKPRRSILNKARRRSIKARILRNRF
jgi:hypothetical protein